VSAAAQISAAAIAEWGARGARGARPRRAAAPHAQLRRVRCGHQDPGSSIGYIGSCKQFPTCFSALEYVSSIFFVVSNS